MNRIILAAVVASAMCQAGCASPPADASPPVGGVVRCPETLGTLAVDDGREAAWWGPFSARTRVTTIEPMLRLVVQRSNCFVVTVHGGGVAPAAARPSAPARRGPRQVPQYVLEPVILVAGEESTEDVDLGRLIGRGLGLAGAAMPTSSTSVTMSIFDVRSGVQVAASEGSATESSYPSAVVGLEPGAAEILADYGRTSAGQAAVAAFVDAYNKAVSGLQDQRAREAPGSRRRRN